MKKVFNDQSFETHFPIIVETMKNRVLKKSKDVIMVKTFNSYFSKAKSPQLQFVK